MKLAIAAVVVLLAVAAVLLFHRDDAKIQGDTAPFEKAIKAYCQRKQYGMAVKSFENLSVEDTSARARCRMMEAQGTYNMTVVWSFAFKKSKDGQWQVEQHQTN